MKRLLVASTALLVMVLGCNTPASDKSGSSPASPVPAAATTVSTVPVVSKKLQTTISLPAQLTPYEQVDIYPKVTGFVQTVTVDRGSRVQCGQVLVHGT
jgi:multidrug efflux pump subunit AcrA (membrane-fusion protein)